MYRGFNHYYREGLKTSYKTVYRNRCLFRYILYFLAEFFGRVLVVFNPHFNIANIRQGYVIRKSQKLSFASAFSNVGQRVPIWTYILTLCFEGLILIAGIVAIALITAVLGAIGFAVSRLASYEDYRLFVALFSAPAIPLTLIYIITALLIFSPTAYIIANNDGVSAGETIGACFKTMLNNGKTTVFLTYFVSGILKSAYLGAMGAGGYFLLEYVSRDYYVITLIALIIITLAGFMTFAPILTLANRVVKEHLFEDIILDPATFARVHEKVNISVCNGQRLQPELASRNLASLFEYTEDPYRILEATKRKSKLLVAEATKPKKHSAEAPKPKAETEPDESQVKASPMAQTSAEPSVDMTGTLTGSRLS